MGTACKAAIACRKALISFSLKETCRYPPRSCSLRRSMAVHFSGKTRRVFSFRNVGPLGRSESGPPDTSAGRCRLSAGIAKPVHAEAQLDRSKVQFVYSGFRPLLSERRSADSSSVTREDHIEVSPSGLMSVGGGKLTTARITAARVLDRVIKKLMAETRRGLTVRPTRFQSAAQMKQSLRVWLTGCGVARSSPRISVFCTSVMVSMRMRSARR